MESESFLLVVRGFKFSAVCLPVADPNLCHAQLGVVVSSRDFRVLCSSRGSVTGTAGPWVHLAGCTLKTQCLTAAQPPSAQGRRVLLGRAQQLPLLLSASNQFHMRAAARPCPGASCPGAAALWHWGEGPAGAFLCLLAAHSQTSGYSSYASASEKYLKGFSVCIKLKKSPSCL